LALNSRIVASFAFFAFIGTSGAAFAQWSSDPANNLTLGDRSGDQTLPKIKPTADGGAFVTWFDNGSVNYKGDTWTWSGTAWTKSTATGPAARYLHAMAYDSTRQRTVMFGGADATSTYSDTWEWDGSSWTQKNVTGPAARQGLAMAFDALHNQIVVFGGANGSGSLLGDTWTYNGSAWTQQSPAASPTARQGHAMAWDSSRNLIVLFGGADASGVESDTWEWDGTNWTMTTGTTPPSARQGHSMAFDPVTATVLLFGGRDVSSTALQDTWTYGVAGWSSITTTTLPPARYNGAMANDNTASGVRTVVFGGYSGTFNVGNTYEFSGTNWASKTTTPTSRNGPALAYDAAHAATVLFGGVDTGGYDVYIQRLNANGLEQFPHNGIQICDRGVSSTVDYDMVVDAAGNAIVGYNDDQIAPGGVQQISVSKISPAGAVLWKTTISSVTSSTSVVSPHLAALSDGNYIVAYSASTPSPGAWIMQKLDPSGVPQWTAPGIQVAETGHYLSLSDIQPADNGSYIVLWIRGFSNSLSSKYLLSQKYDTNGTALWTPSDTTGNSLGPVTGVIIYMPAPGSTYAFNGGTGTYNATQGGSIQSGYFPTMVPDGSGGAVYAWYENAGPRDAYLQHVQANGTPKFQANGVSDAFTALNPGRIRLSAGAAYNPTTGAYFLVSSESSNPTQGNYSVLVQKFNGTGARQWGDTGVTIMPITTTGQQATNAQCQVMGDGVVSTWIWQNSSAADNGSLYAAFTHDTDGGPVTEWNENVSTQNTQKSKLVSAVSTGGYDMLAFGNGPGGSVDLKAVRLNPDGTLGNPATGSCCTNNMCTTTTQAACVGTWTNGGTCTGPSSCNGGHFCGSADFNCDGDVGTDSDIESFFTCLSGTCPALPCISSADFNGDGDVGTDSDIEAFFRVLAGGAC
jgi:hypothetical protein